jgi:HEAT repeat protein
MLAINVHQNQKKVDMLETFATFPLVIEVQLDREVDKLLQELSPDKPWFDRKLAATELGQIRNPEAVPGLIAALPNDPFWMVRCAIIQALEIIGDPTAIPFLQEVAKSDDFTVVRSHAAKAVDWLSREV